MIRGTSRGSLRTSTMSPASTATSVPAPIAMPTSAVTQRRRVVHAVADHRHALARALQLLDLRRLLLGQHLREHRVDAELAARPHRRRLRVAGHHDDLDAARRAVAAPPRADSGRIASATANDGEHSTRPRRGRSTLWPALPTHRSAASRARSAGSRSSRREQRRAAHVASCARRRRAARRGRASPRSRSARGIASPRSSARLHDRPARSGAPSRARRRPRGAAPRRRDHAVAPCAIVDDAELAARERSRLVEDDRGEVARLLEAAPVADEEAAARAKRRGDRDHQRDGQPERVRAGDHEHRHHALDRERRRRRRATSQRRASRRRRRARRRSARTPRGRRAPARASASSAPARPAA